MRRSRLRYAGRLRRAIRRYRRNEGGYTRVLDSIKLPYAVNQRVIDEAPLIEFDSAPAQWTLMIGPLFACALPLLTITPDVAHSIAESLAPARGRPTIDPKIYGPFHTAYLYDPTSPLLESPAHPPERTPSPV